MDWELAARVGSAAGVIGAVTGIGALWVASQANKQAKRSADAAEGSLLHQRQEAAAAANLRREAGREPVVSAISAFCTNVGFMFEIIASTANQPANNGTRNLHASAEAGLIHAVAEMDRCVALAPEYRALVEAFRQKWQNALAAFPAPQSTPHSGQIVGSAVEEVKRGLLADRNEILKSIRRISRTESGTPSDGKP